LRFVLQLLCIAFFRFGLLDGRVALVLTEAVSKADDERPCQDGQGQHNIQPHVTVFAIRMISHWAPQSEK
jgi:hypothetical protein